ncbi:MAG TPA: PEP-CTERM sorting domain-containing protein [Phycisphaerae bacterium]|nr:PEP-CTERM sorting domain-containing protein [Phycisphaerae bacterium]
MNRSVLIAVLTAALAATSAQAQPSVRNTYWNFDVVNHTGTWANDFHVEVQGVDPNQVSDYYTPGGWTVAEGGGSGYTDVDWDGPGAYVAAGATEHFGMGFHDNAVVTGTTMNWTQDGVSIGSTGPARSKWTIWEGGSWDVDNTVWNDFGSAIWVKRRVNTSGMIINLNDLQVGDPLWITGTWLDTTPMRLLSGQSTPTHTWVWQLAIPSYVMMYEIYGDVGGQIGQLEATWLTGAVVLPEPATGVMLLVLGGLALLRRRDHQ